MNKGKIDNAKVICVSDKHKPNEIPTSNWIKEGQWYTIIKLAWINIPTRTLGVKLAEINNDAFFPYTYFKISRFGIPEDQLHKLFQEIEVKEINTLEELAEA